MVPSSRNAGRSFARVCERRAWAVVLVNLEDGWAFAPPHLNRDDLALELARRLRGAETLLRAQRPCVLLRAADLEVSGKVFRMPARGLPGKRVVEPVVQHGVVELAGTEAQTRFETMFGGQRAADLRELLHAVTANEPERLSTAALEPATED